MTLYLTILKDGSALYVVRACSKKQAKFKAMHFWLLSGAEDTYEEEFDAIPISNLKPGWTWEDVE